MMNRLAWVVWGLMWLLVLTASVQVRMINGWTDLWMNVAVSGGVGMVMGLMSPVRLFKEKTDE
jgi:hypothetical protein